VRSQRLEEQLGAARGAVDRRHEAVRSQLVSVSASTETAEQDRLADEVKGLRERVGVVADGMAAAYGPPNT
jgi:hypothetical protein